MTNDELQSVVDDLAERLKRSVAIDDPTIHLLAASRHFGDEDPSRILSVINRAVSSEIADQIAAAGVATMTEPTRVVIDDCLPRICVPVRCDGILLGYLWLIDNDPLVTDAEIELATEAAVRAGVILFRRLLVHERSKARHEAILRELVASDQGARVRAIEDLRAEQLFPERNARYEVIAVHCDEDDDLARTPQGVALEAAVEDALRQVAGEDASLMVANRSRAWILLARRHAPSDAEVDALAARIAARFQELAHGQARLVIGIGAVVDRLEQVIDSYHQAVMAAQAAELVPNIGPVARWDDLGPYKIFLKLSTDILHNAADVPALVELERRDTSRIFLETLEVYLDNAGDARRTAEHLCVHRATLYHRLNRIEQITGCDLDSGYDRLTLHLGLKLRSLAAAIQPLPVGTPVTPSPSRNSHG